MCGLCIVRFVMCNSKANDEKIMMMKIINENSPSGNIFWIFAVASAIAVTDFENGTNWATIFTGNTIQADIVFTAIVQMGVTRE